MKHVAIYHNNTDRSEFALRQPETDADKVAARLAEAGAVFDLSVFHVTEGEFPDDPTQFDAVILTGSPAFIADAHDWIETELDHIRLLDAARIPIVGLCFGHQAVLAALGGKVGKVGAWIFGATEFAIHKQAPWMQPTQSTLRLYAANAAQASTLPDGFELLGGSQACPIAMTAKGSHIFTTQFHPEMDDRFIAELVEEYASEMGPEVEKMARSSLQKRAEGDVFFKWVRNFIETDRTA